VSCLHVVLRDKDGDVSVDELNIEGRHEAVHVLQQKIQEIEDVEDDLEEDDE
jgi:hypothetical protein